ncbi:MAG TPA: VanW family protein [Actinomycetota bacterium]|nr:VanW family protein [Actinomycetota bacterium]
MFKTHLKPSRRGWIVVGVVALVSSVLTADVAASVGRIRPGVKVGSLDLGGRRLNDASELLTNRAKRLTSEPAHLTANGRGLSLKPEQVDFYPDVDRTLRRAKAVGRSGNVFARIWQRSRSRFTTTDVGWHSDIDSRSVKNVVSQLSRRFDAPGREAGIKAEGARIVPVRPEPGRVLDRRGAARGVVRALESWPRRDVTVPFQKEGRKTGTEDADEAARRANHLIRAPITLTSPKGDRVELPPEELAPLLEAVPKKQGDGWDLDVRFSTSLVASRLGERMKQFETEPANASFAVQGSSVSVRPSRDGLKFDPAKTAEALDEAAGHDEPREAGTAFTAAEAALTTEEAKKLKITELVSSFDTQHPCCQPRVKNIHRIADAVDGTVVKPGETFSLNKKAGKRTTEKGYLLAPMIFDGEFKDDVGGGVSQFATTLHNAVFFGGYQFVSYKAHSFYINRYPAGRESTLSWPAPDFKFRNNSSAGVLIKTGYSGGSISVSLYGSKEGKKVTAQAGERKNFTEPTLKRMPNPSLPPGREVMKEKGSQGFDIEVFRIITKGGETTRQRFFTRYKPAPRIIEFGPGAPAGSPTPGAGPTPGGPVPPPTPAQTPNPPATPAPPRTPGP